jgi:ATP-dependent protease ClpP protease subunit
MLEPRTRRPVEVVRQVDRPAAPTAALVLDSLGRMHPATAITIVLTVAGMTAGAVVAIVAILGAVLATITAVVGMAAIGSLGAAILLAAQKTSR